MVDFATWLRRARQAQKMTVGGLSEASGIPARTINSWERASARRHPGAESVAKVEAALGLTMEGCPFDGEALADALEGELAAAGSPARVRLYFREAKAGPCYVGYKVPKRRARGVSSGEGVYDMSVPSGVAVRLLRSSDV